MQNVKSLALLCFCLTLLFSCQPDKEKAVSLLEKARKAIAEQRYEQGLSLIDSLHQQYPSQTAVRREALDVSREAKASIYARDIAYIDSVYPLLQKEVDSLRQTRFVLDVTPGYEEEAVLRLREGSTYPPSGSQYLELYIQAAEQRLQLLAQLKSATPAGLYSLEITELETGIVCKADSLPYDASTNYRYQSAGLYYESLCLPEELSIRILDCLSCCSEGAELEVSFFTQKAGVIRFRLSATALSSIRETYALFRKMKAVGNMEKQRSLLRAKLAHLKEDKHSLPRRVTDSLNI